jgi:hypothetical protein
MIAPQAAYGKSPFRQKTAQKAVKRGSAQSRRR